MLRVGVSEEGARERVSGVKSGSSQKKYLPDISFLL